MIVGLVSKYLTMDLLFADFRYEDYATVPTGYVSHKIPLYDVDRSGLSLKGENEIDTPFVYLYNESPLGYSGGALPIEAIQNKRLSEILKLSKLTSNSPMVDLDNVTADEILKYVSVVIKLSSNALAHAYKIQSTDMYKNITNYIINKVPSNNIPFIRNHKKYKDVVKDLNVSIDGQILNVTHKEDLKLGSIITKSIIDRIKHIFRFVKHNKSIKSKINILGLTGVLFISELIGTCMSSLINLYIKTVRCVVKKGYSYKQIVKTLNRLENNIRNSDIQPILEHATKLCLNCGCKIMEIAKIEVLNFIYNNKTIKGLNTNTDRCALRDTIRVIHSNLYRLLSIENRIIYNATCVANPKNTGQYCSIMLCTVVFIIILSIIYLYYTNSTLD